jgi:hypothetical protein
LCLIAGCARIRTDILDPKLYVYVINLEIHDQTLHVSYSIGRVIFPVRLRFMWIQDRITQKLNADQNLDPSRKT